MHYHGSIEVVFFDDAYNRWNFLSIIQLVSCIYYGIFAIVSLLQIISVGYPGIGKLWYIVIVFATFGAIITVFAQSLSVFFYITKLSLQMSVNHNSSIYIGYVTSVIIYAIIIAINFVWLDKHGGHCCNIVVINPDIPTDPAWRTYLFTQAISFTLDIFAIYCLLKAILAHTNPQRVEIIGQTDYTSFKTGLKPQINWSNVSIGNENSNKPGALFMETLFKSAYN
jgi:hypothetical protein